LFCNLVLFSVCVMSGGKRDGRKRTTKTTEYVTQIDRQTDKQTYIQTDRQTDRQADREWEKHAWNVDFVNGGLIMHDIHTAHMPCSMLTLHVRSPSIHPTVPRSLGPPPRFPFCQLSVRDQSSIVSCQWSVAIFSSPYSVLELGVLCCGLGYV